MPVIPDIQEEEVRELRWDQPQAESKKPYLKKKTEAKRAGGMSSVVESPWVLP
jgi:hypothetical protein